MFDQKIWFDKSKGSRFNTNFPLDKVNSESYTYIFKEIESLSHVQILLIPNISLQPGSDFNEFELRR